MQIRGAEHERVIAFRLEAEALLAERRANARQMMEARFR